MIHPSNADLMTVVNSDAKPGEEPIINSRYSIVMAAAKRARQIIAGDEPMAKAKCSKPFSIAVEELYEGKVKILRDESKEDEFRDDELEISPGMYEYNDLETVLPKVAPEEDAEEDDDEVIFDEEEEEPQDEMKDETNTEE